MNGRILAISCIVGTFLSFGKDNHIASIGTDKSKTNIHQNGEQQEPKNTVPQTTELSTNGIKDGNKSQEHSKLECRLYENPSREELNKISEEVFNILEKEDKRAQSHGKKDAAFVKVKNDKKVMIIGDMHGNLEALLCIPVAEKILQEGGLVVTLGDMIDQHISFGPELALRCLYEVLNLKKKYPDNVVVLRGNHESYFNHSRMGYSIDKEHCDEIVRKCVKCLPLACMVENNGKKFFCVHGGICEDMYKNHSEEDNLGLEKFEDLTHSNTINFQVLWNCFRDKGTSCRKKNVAPLVDDFLQKTGYQAIFRGHGTFQTKKNDEEYNVKDKVYTILSNSVVSNGVINKNDDRNARYAIIDRGHVKVEYFTNSFINGTCIGEKEFIKKCKNYLADHYQNID